MTTSYDREARALFRKYGLDSSGGGSALGMYNSMDEIHTSSTGASIWVGNDTAARSRTMLQQANVTHVINCTENIPNYHEADPKFQYLRFPISYWTYSVDRSHESVIKYLHPLFDFVEKALQKSQSVLVHCLSGAHRAGTAGCLLLMHHKTLTSEEAIARAKSKRPAINPIGLLPDLLRRYDEAVQMEREGLNGMKHKQ